MPIVKMPDGALVNMPDNPSPELLEAVRAKVSALSSQPSSEVPANPAPTMMDKLKKTGKEALRVADYSIRSGVFGLPQLGRDLGNYLSTSEYTPDILKQSVPGVSALNKSLDYIMKPERPETEVGKKIGDVGASVVGAITGPGNLAHNAKVGLGAGLGAETAVQALGDNPVSRIIGALLGGGVTGLATAERNNRPALAREVLADVEPDDLANAMATQAKFKAEGLPMNLSQAMDKPSNIDTYVNTLANLEQGKNTVKTLRAQPGIVQKAMEQQLINLPGTQRAPHIMANNAQDAATAVFKNLNEEKKNIWQGIFAKVNPSAMQEIPEDVMMKAVQTLRTEAKRYSPKDGKFKLLQELQDRLFDGEKFITNPEQLYQTLRDFKSTLKRENLASRNLSTESGKYVASLIGDMRKGLDPVMKAYNQADAASSSFSQTVIDPMKKSVIGRIAGKKGALQDTEASLTPMEQLFKNGTTPGSPSEILKVESEFRKVGQQSAYQDAVKTYLAKNVSKALESTDDRITPNLAGNLRKVFGAPQQLDQTSKGTRDMMIGLARSKGIKDEEAYAKGFQNLMTYISKVSRRPGTVSGTSTSNILDKAENSIFGRLGQFSLLTPIRQPALRWATFLKDDSLKTIDHLLNSPEGVSTLVILGKQPNMNKTAQTALASFFAANANIMANNPSGIQPSNPNE